MRRQFCFLRNRNKLASVLEAFSAFFFRGSSVSHFRFHFFSCTVVLFRFVSMGSAMYPAGKDGSKVTTVVATPGAGPDRPQEVAYTDTKVIGNGSFGVVYQAKLCDSGEMVAIKKVLQDKRFKVSIFIYFPICEWWSNKIKSKITSYIKMCWELNNSY